MQSAEISKRIAFIDTNALLDLFAYWRTCRAFSFPLDKCSNFEDIKLAIANATHPLMLDTNDLEPVRPGLTLFQEMAEENKEWDFFTSQLCLSEMRHTLLEDQATEKLISSRIPYRLRKERPLIVYRKILNQKDFSTLESDVAEFFKQLRDHGIIAQTAEEKATDLRTISIIGEKIWSHVLLEVMDAFIYASAVSSMADVLVTRDSAFRTAVNNLHHPPNEEWKQLKLSLDSGIKGLGIGYSWPEGKSSLHNPLSK